MAKALVTGASGFIGGHLVDQLLARGDEVTCLARVTSSVDRLVTHGVQLVQRDLRDPESLTEVVAGYDVVYHVAGLTKALSGDTMMRVNAEATARLAEACAAQQHPPVLLYVSSIAAAGPSPSHQPCRETDPCRPVSIYGRSKRAGELAVARCAGRVPTTIVRPPIVFGPRDPGCVEMFRPVYRTGVHMMPGYRRRRYSLVYVGELVAGILLAAERGARIDAGDAASDSFGQGCYYVAFAEQPTYGEMGTLIRESLGRRFVVKLPMPDWSVRLAGRVTDAISKTRGRPHAFSADKVREATAGSWTCSTQSIEEELGFTTTATLPQRFRQTAEWFRQEGWLS